MLKEYLSETDIENIKNHKYKTTGYSWLDNKMNPFWEFCSNNLPYYITPNMVTLIGVIAQLIAIVFIFLYDVTLSKEVPQWLLWFFIFTIFFGQTTDAIDGKHARNTKRCSPLGQMMDHGCDAFSNSFIIIMASQAYRYSGTLYSLITQILVQLNFYFYNWDENVTGVMMTNFNNFGITEFQFLSMGLILIPTVMGHQFCDAKVIMGFSLSDYIVFANLLLGLKGVFHLFSKNIHTKDDIVNKGYPILSMVVLVIAELLVGKLILFREYTLWVILINAVQFGYLVSKVIVSTMSHKPIEAFNYHVLLYLIIILVCIFSNSIWVELGLFCPYALYISLEYFRYMLSIMTQLMRSLNIRF